MTAMSGSTAALETQSAQVSAASDLGTASAQASEAVIGPEVAPAPAERPDEVNLVDERSSERAVSTPPTYTRPLRSSVTSPYAVRRQANNGVRLLWLRSAAMLFRRRIHPFSRCETANERVLPKNRILLQCLCP
ncbi:uncharacterized protein LOC135377096 [Ornithodoros turicata]|uniref:uncharacterized protein LOC135373626 n=1 Tax=Ornithodoros turicata TaxID=34597 RepID=UPI003138B070